MDDDVSPLYISSQENHPEVVAKLLEYGADVNLCCFRGGLTPLCVAVSKGNVEVVKVILKYDALLSNARSLVAEEAVEGVAECLRLVEEKKKGNNNCK
jgi:ankyrin repeat protein